MKKLALAFMAASAAVFGMGMVAEAQTYTTAVTVGTVAPGGGYTATYTNCVPGETITFSQPDSTPTTTTGVCTAPATVSGSIIGFLLPAQATSGTATGTFSAAPLAPGTYTVTAAGTESPERTTTFTIAAQETTTTTAAVTTTVPATVPGGGLPATGSDGMGTTTGIAIGLLAVGLGLFAVAQVRRRQPTVA